ncbi:carbohydrate kinase family protein [Rhodovulum adriaticum]|uniref:Fructokinase n=1 Tax=Rhodovulum adriaticum TaxID=35804 RepID=A0A4R2NJX9_RHOAD|nr:carbohydrate kinase [Rhodovulum adriaticum]MBK1635578.1 carbohydrate kinase [Rhodovulum adriaticum]TCP21787.1 fructokinase [Rhodovulum adriaticum]
MILCAGEALIDMLPRPGTDCPAPHTGGAAHNTAVALGRLGARVGFFAPVSTDPYGVLLIDALAEAGVDTTLCPRVDRPTTLAHVRLGNGDPEYAFEDENSAGRMLTAADLPDLPDAVEAVLCGGISLAAEPCGSAFEALFHREKAARVTMLDLNIRPDLITDEAAYRARLARMIAAADIVKLSDEDLQWLDDKAEAHPQAQRLLAQGPRLILLTRGAAGVSAYWGASELHLPAPVVQVIDTVGAGDTFNAGLLAALQAAGKLNRTALAGLGAETLEQVLTHAMRAAAVTVSRAGANPPWAHELT